MTSPPPWSVRGISTPRQTALLLVTLRGDDVTSGPSSSSAAVISSGSTSPACRLAAPVDGQPACRPAVPVDGRPSSVAECLRAAADVEFTPAAGVDFRRVFCSFRSSVCSIAGGGSVDVAASSGGGGDGSRSTTSAATSGRAQSQ